MFLADSKAVRGMKRPIIRPKPPEVILPKPPEVGPIPRPGPITWAVPKPLFTAPTPPAQPQIQLKATLAVPPTPTVAPHLAAAQAEAIRAEQARQQRIRQLQSEIRQLTRQLQEVSKALERTKWQSIGLWDEIQRHKRWLQDYEAEHEETKKKLDALKKEHATLTAMLEESPIPAAQAQEAREKIATLARQITYAEALIEEYENRKRRLEELQAQYERAENMKARHQAEIDRINQRLDEIAQELNRLYGR
jgi:predicted  nucleic acid-binding Zn-ribbon protein